MIVLLATFGLAEVSFAWTERTVYGCDAYYFGTSESDLLYNPGSGATNVTLVPNGQTVAVKLGTCTSTDAGSCSDYSWDHDANGVTSVQNLDGNSDTFTRSVRVPATTRINVNVVTDPTSAGVAALLFCDGGNPPTGGSGGGGSGAFTSSGGVTAMSNSTDTLVIGGSTAANSKFVFDTTGNLLLKSAGAYISTVPAANTSDCMFMAESGANGGTNGINLCAANQPYSSDTTFTFNQNGTITTSDGGVIQPAGSGLVPDQIFPRPINSANPHLGLFGSGLIGDYTNPASFGKYMDNGGTEIVLVGGSGCGGAGNFGCIEITNSDESSAHTYRITISTDTVWDTTTLPYGIGYGPYVLSFTDNVNPITNPSGTSAFDWLWKTNRATSGTTGTIECRSNTSVFAVDMPRAIDLNTNDVVRDMTLAAKTAGVTAKTVRLSFYGENCTEAVTPAAADQPDATADSIVRKAFYLFVERVQ